MAHDTAAALPARAPSDRDHQRILTLLARWPAGAPAPNSTQVARLAGLPLDFALQALADLDVRRQVARERVGDLVHWSAC
jgi:hypothetical protein